MKFKNTEIPDWLENKLKHMSPSPDFNDLIEVLLIDYIERNSPKLPNANAQPFWDEDTKPSGAV